jgi:glycine/D-amino acid oxidase-like deaminating enzyme
MKLESYWLDTAPKFAPVEAELPARVDVAVVGGGFTGLSAALALAKRGARVALFEAGEIAGAASGRNGGHVNSGLTVDFAALVKRVGPDNAKVFYRCYDSAVDTVEQVIRDDGIDCDFGRHGKLKLASLPLHFEKFRASQQRLAAEIDPSVELLDARAVRDEIGSDAFHGGLLLPKSAQMHMGKFAHGLAVAAQRAGARIFANCPVNRFKRLDGNRHTVETDKGSITADQVLLATGPSNIGNFGSFGYFRRRLVPVGSFVIVTAPLGQTVADGLLPRRRTYVTSQNMLNYFRLTPDTRLVFGGRARFAMSNPQSDAKSGEILKAALVRMFPQTAGVPIEYCFGGLVDMNRDRMPRAGVHDGVFYSMGYSGHGTQMAVHMGRVMARVMAGETGANPWRVLPWDPVFGHFGTPWFLPAVGLYYRGKDALDRARSPVRLKQPA